MIILISRLTDETILKVIHWLICYNKKFHRVNDVSELLNDFSYDHTVRNYTFRLSDGSKISGSEIESFFFHGGSVNISFGIKNLLNENVLNNQIEKFLNSENSALFKHILHLNKNIKIFGLSSFDGNPANKLSMLHLAEDLGINIPPTAIITSKTKLYDIKKNWGRIINKSIDDGIFIHTSKVSITGQRTVEVTDEIIDTLDNYFLPSLIQKFIPKSYEVRVYFFRDEIYSIAIFTNVSEITEIDGRTDDPHKLKRQVPYNIPKELNAKIIQLMKMTNLNYGSLDFIYGLDGKYYFLEVNPYGQFGFVSTWGNYFLEKKIAEYL